MTKCYPHRVISLYADLFIGEQLMWNKDIDSMCIAGTVKKFWFTVIKTLLILTSSCDAANTGINFEMYFCPVKIRNCTTGFFFYVIIISIKG